VQDVRFKNHGLESIEVQDNGAGIAPADYETIGEEPRSAGVIQLMSYSTEALYIQACKL